MVRSAAATAFLATLSFVGSAGAQEYITNNYYYSPPPPGLDHGIAQGSIFIVRDPPLSGYIASQGVPLQTSLGGQQST